ncbi:primary-amine oxidase [Gulosibacter macacae]|uniref:Amine oxidase n=1 Tax=Gulosibacter macacae TaxID=2488791 RepID=A0A3P3VZQ5_9MICO|nr:primary-amine oxidase [Gulosibacter macacae]RRJ88292.1 primary-amine oxidase [Gulosibacter macacae]
MPDRTHTHGKRVSRITQAQHPLDMLTPDEISAGRSILEAAGKLTETSLFPTVLPVEPPKDDVRAFTGGDFDRRILFVVLEPDTGVSTEYTVSLGTGAIVDERKVASDVHPYGQPPYTWTEFMKAEELVKKSEKWQAAMRGRGFTQEQIDLAYIGPLAPGFFDYEEEVGQRMIRSITFLRDHANDSQWAHPVEGLLTTLNLTTGEVVSILDEPGIETASVSGAYDRETIGEVRDDLMPLDITQPQGPSFHVDGSEVTWQRWKMRIGFNQREGLVLNQVSFRDGDEDRPILYRGSVPEMVVPYGDTSINRYWISYFDAGEYHLGKNANSLALGCDCLGVIHYFDATVANDDGTPLTIPQAVCMHEEDYGVLWKHTELGFKPDVRRQRRLVVSYFATIGNYDYGFYWYFYLDGTIEVEAKATGIVYNGSGVPGQIEAHRNEIAPGLYAPYHQHIFCARLDVEIDGANNAVDEVDAVRIPMGEQNPYGNAFTLSRTRLTEEGGRDAKAEVGRTWHVVSKGRKNYVGTPTSYQLVPQNTPSLLADPEAFVSKRAAFATKTTWVTKFNAGEYWPAGDYPNQHAGGAGLPSYVNGEDVDGGDIVVWHSFGPTHFPRLEDWPIMPVDRYHFEFKPYGFFDRNPALDVPEVSEMGGSCCASDAEESSCCGSGEPRPAGNDDAVPAEGGCGEGCTCDHGRDDEVPFFGEKPKA